MSLFKVYMEAVQKLSDKQVSISVLVNNKKFTYKDTIDNLKDAIEELHNDDDIDDDTFHSYLDELEEKEHELKLKLSKTQAFKDYITNKMRNKNVKDKDKFISDLLGNNSLKELEKLI